MRLAGKTAVITGSGNGMGAAEARLFAAEGASVAVCDIDLDAATAVAEEVTSSGGTALPIRQDVTDEGQWSDVLDTVAERFGPVNVLVNNAGINGGRAAFESTTLEQFKAVLDVNAAGVFLGTREASTRMRDNGGGSIVNISSVSGLTGALYPVRDDTPNVGYNASKAAVLLLTKMGATQFGAWGVRVNSVHPGFIATAMSAASVADPERMEYFMHSIPMKRPGTPDDVARAVLFLASDDSAFINGVALPVDGGFLAKS